MPEGELEQPKEYRRPEVELIPALTNVIRMIGFDVVVPDMAKRAKEGSKFESMQIVIALKEALETQEFEESGAIEEACKGTALDVEETINNDPKIQLLRSEIKSTEEIIASGKYKNE